MNYGQRFVTLYRRQVSRPSPRKKKCKKAKWLSKEALQIAMKRREAKSKGEKERYKHLNEVVLEKTLESPLDCKEIQPVHSEGNQPWDFFGGNDAEAETPVLWPPHEKIGRAHV